MNDFLCGIQDAIAKGKVDERVDRTRRALGEMETKKTTGKQWDNWYENDVKERREKLKWHWKVMKRETMRIEEANTALVRRNV